MKRLVSDFYGHSNAVIASFINVCDSQTLDHLLSVFCSSLYGIELFNYNHKYMSYSYVAWRKVIRRIFMVPYYTHNDIVIKLGGDI